MAHLTIYLPDELEQKLRKAGEGNEVEELRRGCGELS
jgi:hypothetical protein